MIIGPVTCEFGSPASPCKVLCVKQSKATNDAEFASISVSVDSFNTETGETKAYVFWLSAYKSTNEETYNTLLNLKTGDRVVAIGDMKPSATDSNKHWITVRQLYKVAPSSAPRKEKTEEEVASALNTFRE